MFDYGKILYKHRFSIKRSLNDYEEIILNKCIRTSLELKYKTVACDNLIFEFQIVYKDDNDKLHCICLDLNDYTIQVLHKGDMQLHI